ncbi:hypothetical protein [Streptomyces umbrinus]|uniref:hypothetical protein n=1 Tax=Streptomyces umbrinus TaxID=67370 RepID=UPI00340EDF54
MLTDEELDDVDDPQAVMQGWLDTIKDHRGAFLNQVEYAILDSRQALEGNPPPSLCSSRPAPDRDP